MQKLKTEIIFMVYIISTKQINMENHSFLIGGSQTNHVLGQRDN